MQIPANKKVVCLTGNVWTGVKSLDPRRLLEQNGFIQPTWFTTGLPTTQDGISFITGGDFTRGKLEDRILAFIDFGGDKFGILKSEMEIALSESENGALVCGPQDIVALVADAIPQAIVFTVKAESMTLSHHLAEAEKRGQLKRIDVDNTNPRSWEQAWKTMAEALGLAE